MRKLFLEHASAWLVAVSVILFSAFASPTLAQTEGAQPRAVPERDSLVAYSRDFAKRFAFDAPAKELELSAPLQALEFRVERSRWRPGMYECLLSVYVDSRLPLYFPTEGPVGTAEVDLALGHFFVHPNKGREHWMKLSIEDRRHFGEIASRFRGTAAIATADYEPLKKGVTFQWKGAYFSMGVREFHRELFPALTYFQLNIGCHVPRWLGAGHPTQLWLKREDGKDYTKFVHMDPSDFVRLDLPRVFVERISVIAEEAAQADVSRPEAAQGDGARR